MLATMNKLSAPLGEGDGERLLRPARAASFNEVCTDVRALKEVRLVVVMPGCTVGLVAASGLV
jgi:hypothetical protein